MVYLAVDFANEKDAAVRGPFISAAKVQVSHSGQIVGRGAIQLHGGIGVTDELDIGLFLKRGRAIQQTFGDAVFHNDRYARLNGF